MSETVRELRGGNMDIDLVPKPNPKWKQDPCPWNEADGSTAHLCAVKDTLLQGNKGRRYRTLRVSPPLGRPPGYHQTNVVVHHFARIGFGPLKS